MSTGNPQAGATTTTAQQPGAGTNTASSSATQPQAGTTTTPNPQAGEEEDNQPISLEAARKLRSEAQNLRDRLKAAEGKVKEFETAQLTEAQKLQKERDDALNAAKAAKLEARNDRIAGLAARLGFADPDDAKHFLHADAEDLEAALKEVLKTKPYLKASGQTAPAVPTSPTSPARSATNAQTFTKSQIADRTFWKANKDAIMKAIAEGRIVEG